MKILVKIQSSDFLRCHEALSLAFAMVAFDHEIQLELEDGLLAILQTAIKSNAPSDKLGKMLSSLDLYDMPPAWVAADKLEIIQAYNPVPIWRDQISARPTSSSAPTFDLILVL